MSFIRLLFASIQKSLIRPNLCLELTGFAVCVSSQLGSLKHTQLFLNNQLLPAIQVGR
jgi:hypothetical protein